METHLQNEILKIFDSYKQEIKLKQYDEKYIISVYQFIKYCFDKDINPLEATYEHFSAYMLYKREVCQNSNASLNKNITRLKCFYKFCLEHNFLKSNKVFDDFCLIKTFKHQSKIYDVITKEELENLIVTAVQRGIRINPYKLKALLYLMLYTGLRRNEVVNLKREDIDLVNRKGIVRLPNKSKREREFYFPQKIADMLSYYFSIEKQVTNAFNVNYNAINNIIKNISQSLKSKKISAHTFKRSFANMLMEAGVDVSTAQHLLGHSRITTTMIYYKPSKKRIEKNYRDFIN